MELGSCRSLSAYRSLFTSGIESAWRTMFPWQDAVRVADRVRVADSIVMAAGNDAVDASSNKFIRIP